MNEQLLLNFKNFFPSATLTSALLKKIIDKNLSFIAKMEYGKTFFLN